MANKKSVEKDKSFALASFICGLLIFIPLFNIILGGLALIFGILALKRIQKDPVRYGGSGFAITGVVLGCIAIIFALIWGYLFFFEPDMLR
ncbi:MAG: DUF4190 domain-containing protein [Candidatus Woesearchaeota archaeon]